MEKDVEENKDLMKNDSVQSLSYPHELTPKLPTSVAPSMSNLSELINNVRSSSSSSSLSLSLLGVGWVYMNLMEHNLVERGLSEYKVGLLYLLGRIMRRGKGHTSRRGGGNSYHHGIRRLYQEEASGKSTTFTTWKIGDNP